jgi:hypothetical protein
VVVVAATVQQSFTRLKVKKEKEKKKVIFVE